MFLAILLLSLWLAMAIVIFISHGRQEYCLTKHLVRLLVTFLSLRCNSIDLYLGSESLRGHLNNG